VLSSTDMKILWFTCLAWFLPLISSAASIVPCNPKIVNGVMVDNCGICEAGKLLLNVSDWLVMVSGILVVLIIIGGGLILVVSTGNVSAKGSARKLISTALIGYAILLGAWILVDTFMKFLIPGSSYGLNHPLICP